MTDISKSVARRIAAERGLDVNDRDTLNAIQRGVIQAGAVLPPIIIEIPLNGFGPVKVSQDGNTSKLLIRRKSTGHVIGPVILEICPHVPTGGEWSWMVTTGLAGNRLEIKLDLPLTIPDESSKV